MGEVLNNILFVIRTCLKLKTVVRDSFHRLVGAR